MAMALLLTLRGTPFLYYGEEIGMRDISLRRREILDPSGKKYWPVYRGRDGCRSILISPVATSPPRRRIPAPGR